MPLALVVSGVLIAAVTYGLLMGAVYLGGGMEAIRRQRVRLALFAPLLLTAAFVPMLLMQSLGWMLASVVAYALGGLALIAQWRRRRSLSHEELERRRARFRAVRPQFLVLVTVWILAVIGITFAGLALSR